ncbi:hypothetical protein [Desulfonatronovibrio magnus]|uniref:hypothetical protein n=1 Tax=Desulfonatronovibrio magnus TaxID=698827 RepID=UPI0005EB5BAE|nr:hypothetical protein [Desulfonatronovibrio magnus]
MSRSSNCFQCGKGCSDRHSQDIRFCSACSAWLCEICDKGKLKCPKCGRRMSALSPGKDK